MLVVGGGAAGVAAAVSAARSGAGVILLERHGYLGGKATAANVGTICGLYVSGHAPKPRYVMDGFLTEFAETMIARTGDGPVRNRLGLHFLPYRPFDFRRVSDEFLHLAGVDVFLHTVISDIAADRRIREVTAIARDRKLHIIPQQIVDCTGEALCTTLAGGAALADDLYQTVSQVFAMENVRASDEVALGIAVIRDLQQAVRNSALPATIGRVSLVPGSWRDGHVDLKINLAIMVSDDLNQAAGIERQARAAVEQVCQTLQRHVSGFAQAHLGEVATEAGIRTGRRSPGRYLLTREDVLGGKKTSFSQAKGCWPVEKWGLPGKPSLELLAEGDHYDIPDACLASQDFENLYFAGRHISADVDAIASARVIGTCLATGFAAGRMAAAPPANGS